MRITNQIHNITEKAIYLCKHYSRVDMAVVNHDRRWKGQTFNNSTVFGCSMLLYVFIKISVLNLVSVHAALKNRSTFDESNLTSELTVHLVQKCLLQDDRTVAVIGDVPEEVVKTLHLGEIAATANVGHYRSRADGLYGQILHSKSLYRESSWIRLQRVVQAFVVAAPSQPLLRLALETAKSSVWWNSAAFFVVTSTTDKSDCRNAFTYLWTLWQMGILDSVFLCNDSDGGLAMYGYSPYYDGHSKSWRKVGVYAGRGGHPWALLKLKQVHDVNICEMIAFDKVKRLDGHVILIGALTIPPTLVVNECAGSWFSKHVGEDAMMAHIIWKALDGSMETKYYGGDNPIGFTGANQSYTGFMADVSLGSVDYGMNGLYTNLHWRIRSAYPHAVSRVHFLTPSKGNMPNWLKLATIYKIPVTIGIQATLFSGTIFLRYVDHRPWSVAILEILRVTLSMTMSRLPRRLGSRIFWSMAFFMMLVITSGFQSSLISLLTKPTPYRNIDGIDDVLASGYDIYGYPPFKEFFDESKLSGKFHVDDNNISCFIAVAQGRPIACVSEYMYLRSITMVTDKSHVSKESVSSFYTAYLTRLDWPLFNRFDTIVQRLFNSGITGFWREFYLDEMVRKHWAKMRNTLPSNLKVLSITDLAFVFHILIGGLLCSSAAFIIERILGCIRQTLN